MMLIIQCNCSVSRKNDSDFKQKKGTKLNHIICTCLNFADICDFCKGVCEVNTHTFCEIKMCAIVFTPWGCVEATTTCSSSKPFTNEDKWLHVQIKEHAYISYFLLYVTLFFWVTFVCFCKLYSCPHWWAVNISDGCCWNLRFLSVKMRYTEITSRCFSCLRDRLEAKSIQVL